MAESDALGGPIILVGGKGLQQVQDGSDEEISALAIPVGGPEELQLVLGAIVKFKAVVDYFGDPWEEFGQAAQQMSLLLVLCLS